MPEIPHKAIIAQQVEASPACHRVGCANFQNIIENIEDSPSETPCSDDHYTILLHNSEDNQGLTVSDHSRKSSKGYF